uniref:Uncharacterized protein n=1 Tax=Anguilla anguilla TaxID=7936 RepID=A0A0E9UJC7_ANGAN
MTGAYCQSSGLPHRL